MQFGKYYLRIGLNLFVSFVAFLYLFGYALTGFNLSYYVLDGSVCLLGTWDDIVPLERVLCGGVSVYFFVVMIINLSKLVVGYIGVMKREDKSKMV